METLLNIACLFIWLPSG